MSSTETNSGMLDVDCRQSLTRSSISSILNAFDQRRSSTIRMSIFDMLDPRRSSSRKSIVDIVSLLNQPLGNINPRGSINSLLFPDNEDMPIPQGQTQVTTLLPSPSPLVPTVLPTATAYNAVSFSDGAGDGGTGNGNDNINCTDQSDRNPDDDDISINMDNFNIEGTDSQMSQTAVPEDLLQQWDIVCGRDKSAFNHIGNRRFRMTMNLNLQRYIDAPTREAKTDLIKHLHSYLEDEIGYRFLKKADDKTYVTMTEKQIREKIGHSLRDLVSARRRKMNNQKKKGNLMMNKKNNTSCRHPQSSNLQRDGELNEDCRCCSC